MATPEVEVGAVVGEVAVVAVAVVAVVVAVVAVVVAVVGGPAWPAGLPAEPWHAIVSPASARQTANRGISPAFTLHVYPVVGTVRTLQGVSGRTAIAVGVLTLASLAVACSGGQQSAATRAQDQRFVDGVHESATDVSKYRTDDQLIKMGHVTCDGFRASANIEQIASLLERNASDLPPGDIGAVISTAVHVLCPEYGGRLNPAAPGG